MASFLALGLSLYRNTGSVLVDSIPFWFKYIQSRAVRLVQICILLAGCLCQISIDICCFCVVFRWMKVSCGRLESQHVSLLLVASNTVLKHSVMCGCFCTVACRFVGVVIYTCRVHIEYSDITCSFIIYIYIMSMYKFI